MKQILISDIVAQPHLADFNCNKPHQLIHGGRRGYKSSKHGIKFALRLLEDPRAELIVVREDYSDHRHSTFPALKRAFYRLGIKLIKGVHCSSDRSKELWIKLPQGNYVHFRHMKEIDKLKGTEPIGEQNQIKMVWYFEITEFKNERHIVEANATFMSGAQDYFWAIYEWNDAPKTQDWTYKFAKEMRKRPDALVKKVNYNDAPQWQQEKFLGKLLLNEINMLKKLNYDQWRSVYQGFPANLSGGCYKSFRYNRNVKPATHKYVDITVGVDYGGNDATVCTALGRTEKYKSMEVIDTYYHKNGHSLGIKNINEYAKDIMNFCQMIYREYNKPVTIFLDTANNTTMGMLLEELIYEPQYNFIVMGYLNKLKKRRGTNKKKSAIQERIDVTEIMFASGYLTINNDNDKNTELLSAIEEAVYDKNGNRLDNDTVNVDSLDSLEYAWLMEMDFIYDMIIGSKIQPLEIIDGNNTI